MRRLPQMSRPVGAHDAVRVKVVSVRADEEAIDVMDASTARSGMLRPATVIGGRPGAVPARRRARVDARTGVR